MPTMVPEVLNVPVAGLLAISELGPTLLKVKSMVILFASMAVMVADPVVEAESVERGETEGPERGSPAERGSSDARDDIRCKPG